MNVDDELVAAFLEESNENLDQLDLDLVALEEHPDDPELLARIFRTIHTVKGTCGFLDFAHLQELAHAGEDLLAELRAGRLRLTPEITTGLLHLVDEIRGVLAVVADTGGEGDADHQRVIAELRGLLEQPQQSEPETPGPAAPAAPAPAAPGHAAPAPAASPADTAPPAHTAATQQAGSPPGDVPAVEETSLRIDVAVLDTLQDLVGELTLARMRIGDFIAEDGPQAQSFHRLTLITRELQDAVMSARLQPIGTVIGRLRRIVRDVATAQGKQVRFVVSGEEVAVDKAINEILRDPLVHLVRNAVDHGIETPAERQSAGKSPTATLQIQATLLGGGVHIEVSDDGRGVDTQALVARALASGQLTAQRAQALNPNEQLALLFLPGVSTAATVTSVSGRGVGMDVVRSKIEQVGGSIQVQSHVGAGTTFLIDVPLTLAILPAIIITCGPGRFTIPQADVAAVVRVAAEERAHQIRHVGEAAFLRHLGTLLPLVDLRKYLGVAPATGSDDAVEIVVISRAGRSHGLIVDAVGDSVEAVVKPLPRAIRGVGSYVGTTVLADGRASPILEAVAPALAADVHSYHEAHSDPVDHGTSLPTAASVLVVTLADEQIAIPLDRIRRLEQLAADAVESSGHTAVVQYRGAILPVVVVADVLRLPAVAPGQNIESAQLSTVVCATSLGLLGLIVDEIVDIATAPPGDWEQVAIPGTAGRTVVADRVTLVLDVDEIARMRLQPDAAASAVPMSAATRTPAPAAGTIRSGS